MIREVERKAHNGLVMLGLWLLVGALIVWQFIATAADRAAFGGGGMRVAMIEDAMNNSIQTLKTFARQRGL